MSDDALALGSKVRFRARFELAGKSIEPACVIATIVQSNHADTYTVGTGLMMDGDGRYHVDVRLDNLGPVTVRFASELTSEQRQYTVEKFASSSTSPIEPEPEMRDDVASRGWRGHGR